MTRKHRASRKACALYLSMIMPHRLIMLALGTALLTLTAGCQSANTQTTQRPQPSAQPPVPPSNAHIFSTDPVRLATNTAPPERFEFARRDPVLSLRTPAPLRATTQWPGPPRPLERRIIFRWWEQR